MNDIIKSTDVLHKDKPIELETKENVKEWTLQELIENSSREVEKDMKTYEVSYFNGEANEEFEVEADHYFIRDGILYFERKNELSFMLKLDKLIYVNAVED